MLRGATGSGKSSRTARIILLSIGSILAIIAILVEWSSLVLVYNGNRVIGNVTQIEAYQGECNKRVGGKSRKRPCTKHRAHISFSAADGSAHAFVTPNTSGLSEGGAVEIIYNPQNPEQASVNSFQELYLLPLLLAVIATVFLLLGSFASRLFVSAR